MALTSNGFRTGRAGASDLEDTREMIRNAQDEERQRKVNEKYLNEERELLGEMEEKHGEEFWKWYYSPDVPDGGRASERIKLIRAWDALQEPAEPLTGYPVKWTDKEPPTMTTIWNDDDPHGVELKPKPAPQQNGTG